MSVQSDGPPPVIKGCTVDPREYAVLSGAASGALVRTEDSFVPFEWLAVGDRVLTRDCGPQTVRWIARSPLSMAQLRTVPELAPVLIEAEALGPGVPLRSLTVSPSQLIQVTGPGGANVLVTADTLGDPIYPMTRAKSDVVTYMNVLLDAHHLIEVDGMWIGSVFTADLDVDSDDPNCTGPMEPLAPILNRAAAMQLLHAAKQAEMRLQA